jgi:hypothetical protein
MIDLQLPTQPLQSSKRLSRWLDNLLVPSFIERQPRHALKKKERQNTVGRHRDSATILPTTTMSANNLPEDILYGIFKHLSISELDSAAMVCKTWTTPASILLDRRRRHIRNLASCTLSQVIFLSNGSPIEHKECLQYFEKLIVNDQTPFVSRSKSISKSWFGAR